LVRKLKLKKLNITYLILQKNVILNGIGGKSHVEGILRSFKKNYNLHLVGVGLDNLIGLDNSCKKTELGNISYFKFYYKILMIILMSPRNSIFLYRKTLLGILIICPFLYLINSKSKNFTNVLEINGISGDYKYNTSTILKLLAFFNYLCFKQFEVLYCVNFNIANRINLTNPKLKNHIVVAKNGGFGPSVKRSFLFNKKKYNNDCIDLVFYGSEQNIYALDDFVKLLNNYVQKNELKKVINLHLIGSKFSSYDYKRINYPGSMNRVEFSDYICNLDFFTFGLIPLKNVNLQDDILPMKYFDYISCGLPSIATYSPNTDNKEVKNSFFTYKLSNKEVFHKMFKYLSNISDNQMLTLRLQSLELAKNLDWNLSLLSLKNKINQFSKTHKY
jgi:hypothetical protein